MDGAQLELARQVHYAFLPQDYADEHLQVSVTAAPHAGLGGDYCGIVPLPDEKVALTMCDATGHDIASALFAARINTYVLGQLVRTQQPCGLIESLNEFLAKRMGDTNMQATFCAAILDPRAASWEFAGAGHPPAIHFRARHNDTVLVKSQTTMVGIFETLRVPCHPTPSTLEKGDRILLFTDGLTDARDATGAIFGLDRLQDCVLEHAGLAGPEFNEALFAAARAHGDDDLGDDALLMTATRR